VTVTTGFSETSSKLRVHRSSTIPAHDRRERDGIPVTAPLRTIFDLASCVSDFELDKAIAEAFAVGMVSKGMVERAIVQRRGHRGVARVRALLGGGRRPSRTRSKPERKLRSLLTAAGIEGFETNAHIGPWEVDFYFRSLGLAVEVDAYVTHSSPWAFERDRRKTTALEDHGLTVHRVTDVQIAETPGAVVEGIRSRIRRLADEIRRSHRIGG
jgi:very-short-patch-repair endonuclease